MFCVLHEGVLRARVQTGLYFRRKDDIIRAGKPASFLIIPNPSAARLFLEEDHHERQITIWIAAARRHTPGRAPEVGVSCKEEKGRDHRRDPADAGIGERRGRHGLKSWS